MSGSTKPASERSHTDESLRTERDKSDHAIVEATTKIAENADEVLQLARDNADAIVPGRARKGR